MFNNLYFLIIDILLKNAIEVSKITIDSLCNR